MRFQHLPQVHIRDIHDICNEFFAANYRLVLTTNSQQKEVSRAMKNRGVTISTLNFTKQVRLLTNTTLLQLHNLVPSQQSYPLLNIVGITLNSETPVANEYHQGGWERPYLTGLDLQ